MRLINKCISSSVYSRLLLFVLLVLSFSLSYSVISPQTANAWAPLSNSPPLTDPQIYGIIDAKWGVGFATNKTVVLYERADVASHYYISVIPDDKYAVYDGGSQTGVGVGDFCEIPVGSTTSSWCSNGSGNYNQGANLIFRFIASPNVDTSALPDEYVGGSKPVIKPDFKYEVNNKDVSAKDVNKDLPEFTPDEGYKVKGYSLEWSLWHCVNDWDENTKKCNSGAEMVKYDMLLQNRDFEHSVSKYGKYNLTAQYMVQQCYRYPSYPATPDHCFYADLGQELPDYDFTSTSVPLEIDGSTYSGDTRDGECDESGFCLPPSPYEDCSVYGLDIVGGLGCVMRNFGTFMGILLRMLLIPNFAILMQHVEETHQLLIDKLGFLWTPFEFFIQLFSAFVTAENDCSPSFSGIPGTNVAGDFFGTIPNLSVCSAQQDTPNIYNIAVFFIRVVTVITLIYALYRRFTELMTAQKVI